MRFITDFVDECRDVAASTWGELLGVRGVRRMIAHVIVVFVPIATLGIGGVWTWTPRPQPVRLADPPRVAEQRTTDQRYDQWLAEAWSLEARLSEVEAAHSMGAELRMLRLRNLRAFDMEVIDPTIEPNRSRIRQIEALRSELSSGEAEYIRAVTMRGNVQAAIGAMR